MIQNLTFPWWCGSDPTERFKSFIIDWRPLPPPFLLPPTFKPHTFAGEKSLSSRLGGLRWSVIVIIALQPGGFVSAQWPDNKLVVLLLFPASWELPQQTLVQSFSPSLSLSVSRLSIAWQTYYVDTLSYSDGHLDEQRLFILFCYDAVTKRVHLPRTRPHWSWWQNNHK